MSSLTYQQKRTLWELERRLKREGLTSSARRRVLGLATELASKQKTSASITSNKEN